jgi:hypothetical protein
MQNVLNDCPTPAKPSIDHIQDCQDQQRQAMEHLVAHLRQALKQGIDVFFDDERRERTRQRRELERAFELYRQADAKVEILIAQFGPRLS